MPWFHYLASSFDVDAAAEDTVDADASSSSPVASAEVSVVLASFADAVSSPVH